MGTHDDDVATIRQLFDWIRESRVVLAQAVPHTREALAEVEFNEAGEPVMETVTPPVWALANAVRSMQLESSTPPDWKERTEAIEKELPSPVAIDDDILVEARKTAGHFGLAFDLFKETASIAGLCSGAFVATTPDTIVLGRDRAIVAALLLRMTKFMAAVLHLAQERSFGEVTLALNRCILESAVDLMYLCHTDDPGRFDRFVKDGLIAERALYDRVNENIARRGTELPIETRLLRGAQRAFRLSGLDVLHVEPNGRSLDLRSKMRAIGREDDYLLLQKMPSAAVHGTWLDLLHHHLRDLRGGFSPRFDHTPADARGFGSVAVFVIDALAAFAERHLSAAPECVVLLRRLDSVRSRVLAVEESHERWLQTARAADRKTEG